MKIKYWVLLYTLGMFLMGAAIYGLVPLEEVSRDMGYYNKMQKQAEQVLAQENPDLTEAVRKEVEAQGNCVFFLCSDEDYEAQLNKFLQRRAVVLDYTREGTVLGKFAWEEEGAVYQKNISRLQQMMVGIWLVSLAAGYLLLLFIYLRMIRPFQELERFSAQIAKGNFDLALPIHKQNLFGAFTESFDLMREELKKAQEREYAANRSKKELVAELSHDIKTPVSTIKAACEVMELTLQEEADREKLRLIEAKADTINSLISNLFHATMEELEALKVEPQPESTEQVMNIFRDLGNVAALSFTNAVPECLVYMDRLRLEQVINNVVNNSVKYAGTSMEVTFFHREEGIGVKIRDFGPGVSEEECALLTEKFFRGSNAKGQDGSGLGLYLSKLFMEQMRGGIEVYCEAGFVVELFLRKVME